MAEQGRASGEERRAAQQQRQRKRLIIAAGETFVARGYATATVADILRQAGMSRRSFYELFTSKEDVLLALLDEMVREVRKEVAAAGVAADDPVETATQMLLSYVRVASRFPVVGYQVMAAGGAARERRRSHLRSFLDALSAEVERAHGAGKFSRGPDRTTVRLLIGGLDHLILSYHMDGRRERLVETEPQVRELFLRAFR